MAKATDKAAARKNGRKAKPVISKLGKDLRRLSDKIATSGEKPLTRWEIEREGRGGSC